MSKCKGYAAAKSKAPLAPWDFQRRDALEHDVVIDIKYCGICHSLDYLTTNSPLLDHQGWTNEVDEMIKIFGASINPAETATIIDYLVRNYRACGDMRSKRYR